MADLDFFVNTPRAVPTGAGDVVLYSTRDTNRPLLSGELATRRIAGWLQTDVAVVLKYQVWTGAAWITYNGPALAGDSYAANAFVSFDIARPAGDVQIVATLAGAPAVWRLSPSVRLALAAGSTSDRQRIYNQSQGIVAETFPRSAFGNNVVTVAGTVYYMGIPLLAGDVVNGFAVAVGVATTAPTLSKIGLYTPGGILIASTADLGTLLTATTGQKIATLAALYGVTVAGLWYLAVLNVGVAAQLVRGSTGVAASGWISPIGGGQALYGVQTGMTDLPAVAAITSGGALGLDIWGAIF